MASFLLDENVSPLIPSQIKRARPEADVVALQTWHGGELLGAGDELVLSMAWDERRTLVTYDLSSIPPLLRRWADAGRSHGGVVLVDEPAIAGNDIGGLVRSLIYLWDSVHDADLTDTVRFLARRR